MLPHHHHGHFYQQHHAPPPQQLQPVHYHHHHHHHHHQAPPPHHQAHHHHPQPLPAGGLAWVQQGGGDLVLHPHLQHQHHHHAPWALPGAPIAADSAPVQRHQHQQHTGVPPQQQQQQQQQQYMLYVTNYPPPPPLSAPAGAGDVPVAGAVAAGARDSADTAPTRRGQQQRRGRGSGREGRRAVSGTHDPAPRPRALDGAAVAPLHHAAAGRMPPLMPALPTWPAVRVGGPAVDAPAEVPAADRARPERYKTALCRHFARQSSCMLGAGCRFAHGDHELRTESANIASGVTTEAAVAALGVVGAAAAEAAELTKEGNDQAHTPQCTA